ncbi:hypothetical protein CR155_11125 [Pollutimonas nitritireducens]|uniref:Uncharacterized protein n=1 Tax=Pollutimonas nitritireducens TaxID=2045209 RepID=A0A2N4UG29_9BURK|nr:hypothetical protein [Pollutimonas nitritireducens]PLC53972.1 hypothetical protein CR155_11125 [Pollutimonas nitritireducens]
MIESLGEVKRGNPDAMPEAFCIVVKEPDMERPLFHAERHVGREIDEASGRKAGALNDEFWSEK